MWIIIGGFTSIKRPLSYPFRSLICRAHEIKQEVQEDRCKQDLRRVKVLSQIHYSFLTVFLRCLRISSNFNFKIKIFLINYLPILKRLEQLLKLIYYRDTLMNCIIFIFLLIDVVILVIVIHNVLKMFNINLCF